MDNVLSLRKFSFPAPKDGACDLLFIAGEHSGDEQAARMLKDAYEQNPDLKVCAFAGESLQETGAQLLFNTTSFSVVGLIEVLKNYTFFKKLALAMVDWIVTHKPKAVCFVDYPGLNLHIAKMLKERGISIKGGGDVKLLFYISPQIWAWKAKRRFKMAEILDELAVIFPFEKKCYADTSLPVTFVGHPFMRSQYESPVVYDKDGEIMLLSGSRTIAVSRIFPVMIDTLRLLPNEKAFVVYPTEAIKNLLLKILSENKDVAHRVRLVENHTEIVKAKGIIMSSGTMSLSCSLEGIPGAVVYVANALTYFLGRMLVNIRFLSIANIILDRPAWKEFIQFDAKPQAIAEYMKHCLKDSTRQEFIENANELKSMLDAPKKMTAGNWLINCIS